jgi:hypothetical protein
MGFRQQDAIRHHFHAGPVAYGVLKTDFIADGLSEFLI